MLKYIILVIVIVAVAMTVTGCCCCCSGSNPISSGGYYSTLDNSDCGCDNCTASQPCDGSCGGNCGQ